MKKLFLSLVAAIVAATATYAQNTLVATLSHGENITMYYGTYALRDAVNAAESGDVINLSGGGFQAVEITKAVTLRGAGINAAVPTSIVNDFSINVPPADVNRFSMEGIRCNGTLNIKGSFENPQFIKCWFCNIVSNESSDAVKNALFANCRITNKYEIRGDCTVQFINSYVSGFDNNYNYGSNTSAAFVNCVILPGSKGRGADRMYRSQLLNCIIYQTDRDWGVTERLPSSSIATNCLSIGYDNLFGAQAASTSNMSIDPSGLGNTFKNISVNYSDSQTFELTDEAKTTYLGNDGTEVGMYGGVMPYTDVPSYPQITRMNVANKTTADGKLSVEIEVSAAE